MIRQKRYYISLIFIFFLLIVNAIYWGYKKEGFHGDEFYSYHYVCNFTSPLINADNHLHKYINIWHKGEYYKDYLILSRDEPTGMSNILENLKYSVHPPLFFIVLKKSIEYISIGKFTKWSGIIPNLFFFVLICILIIKLFDLLMKDKIYGLSACAIYGMSIGAISTIIYIRMYAMLTLAVFLFVYINTILYNCIYHKDNKILNKHTKLYSIYVVIFISTIFGALTHYYFLIFAFFYSLFFCIFNIFHRKYKICMTYIATILLGYICTFFIWPTMYKHIFFSSRGKEAFGNVMHDRFLTCFFDFLYNYYTIINKYLFGNMFHILLLIISCLFLFKFVFNNRNYIKNNRFEFRVNHSKSSIQYITSKHFPIICIFISTSFYIMILAKIAPYIQTGRYIFNIFPLIVTILIYVISNCTDKIIFAILLVINIFFNIGGYNKFGPNYLYKGEKNNIKILMDMKNSISIIVNHRNRRFATAANTLFLSYSDYIYPTDEKGIYTIKKAMKDRMSDNILLYFDKEIKDKNIKNKVMKNFSKTITWKHLFNTQTSEVYLLLNNQ